MADKPPPTDRIVQHQLDDLQQELTREKARLTDETSKIAGLTDDITTLQNAANDGNTALTAYQQAVKGLKSRRNDAEEYYQHRKPIVEAYPKAKRARVEEAVEYVDHIIHTKEAEVKTLLDGRDVAGEQATKAKQALKRAQDHFQAVKTQQATVDTALKKISDLTTLIDQQGHQPKDLTESAYLLVIELGKKLNEVRVTRPEEYAEKLEEAFTKLKEATRDYRRRSSEWDDLKHEYESQNALLQTLKDHRQDHILKKLQGKLPAAPAPAPAAATKA